MGTIAARKAREIVKNVTNVIAVEFLASAQGLDFLDPLRSSKALEAVRKVIRKEVKHLRGDRRLDLDLQKVAEMMTDLRIIEAAEGVVGELG